MQASDISGSSSIPTLDPDARYLGRDASDLVQVEVDGAAHRVAVSLKGEWRRTVGRDALGAAILAAFTAATTTRLKAWAEQAADRRPADHAAWVHADRPHATPETLRMLSRAFRDLQEYRLRLTEFHAATTTTASPDRTVRVTVRGGQIAEIDLDSDWLRAAGDADIERRTGHTVSAALADLSRLPDRALESCPDLRAVLAIQQPEADR